MDAGKFNNFQKLGGMPKTPATNKPQGKPAESPAVQQDPTDAMVFGHQPVADAKVDTVASSAAGVTEAAATVTTAKSNVPQGVEGMGLIADSNAGTTKRSFPGLSLHGLNATSLQGLNGETLASVNALKPKSGAKMPTTSVDFVQSSFEMTNLADSRVAVTSLY